MAKIQSGQATAAGASTVQKSFTSLPAIGSRVYVAVAVWSNALGDNVAVSDNQGHTYTKRWGVDTSASGGLNGYAFFDVVVSTSSGTFTVTADAGTSADLTIIIGELSTAGSFDLVVYDSVSTGAVTVSKNITTTQDNTEIIAVQTNDWGNNPADVAEGGGFTLDQEMTNNNTAAALYTAYRQGATAGTYTPSWTWNDGQSHAAAIGIVAYYDAAPTGQPISKRIKTIPGMGRGFTGHFGVR
jgi:hypothetical protein